MNTQFSNNLKGAKKTEATIKKRPKEISTYLLAKLSQLPPVKAYQSICKQNTCKTFPV